MVDVLNNARAERKVQLNFLGILCSIVAIS
jgi:hypothetical protein